MKRLLTILSFLLIGYGTTNAQQVKLTNDFEFKNGLYLSFESFKNNTPDFTWDEVKYDACANQEKRAIQFKHVKEVDSNKETSSYIFLTLRYLCPKIQTVR